MPLSESNKKQSQSIEDLIAQLDIPASNQAQEGGQQQSPSSTVNSSQQSAAAAAAAAAAARRQMKGRRTYSTSSSGYTGSASFNSSSSSMNGSNNGVSYSSFSKQPSFGQSAEPVLHKNAITSKKYSKKLGRLRNCGAPKKDGAGGKHTWGAPGCELQADDYLDSRDPNYDSEEAGNVVMVCTEAKPKTKADGEDPSSENEEDEDELGRSHRQPKKQLLDTDDLDAEIKPIILEYFQNGDTIEVITLIKKYSLPSRVRPTLVAYLVQLALENNNTSKELISRLLRHLSFEVIASENDYVLGFDLLLKNLPDLTLDNPDAPEKTGTFIARAIADRILARNYLDATAADVASNEKVSKAIESARLLVTMNDHLYHLSHIWGNKGGFLAVQELTDKINEIIQEYHDSADCNEAIRCLKELNVPHFHHEFVFEAIDFALQKGSDQSIELITELLYRLCQSVIITYDQLKMGILRIFDILPDIRLDVPNANSLMEKILKKCQSKGFVTENILDSALNKSRKRFVSEGDGGKIKENGL